MAAILSRHDKLGDGHYTVIKELGVGGMGVVYHCRDEFLQRDVAIKMLLPELVKNPKNLEVFLQEARLAAQLEHPNIVTIYDIGTDKLKGKKHHFVAMEYLTGGSLGDHVTSGPLPVEHGLNWMKQLANGLSFAHKKSVVHQDVKADNIFITTEGDLKIGDFGLARLMANKVYINPSTKGMGTPAYMSPELCRGEQQDHRSDIYSLGVLFFEMTTGQLPYRANGMIEMAMKHTTAAIPSAKRINPQISTVVDKLIRRMMEKTPEDRFESLTEVIKVLDDLIFELRMERMGINAMRPKVEHTDTLVSFDAVEDPEKEKKKRLDRQKEEAKKKEDSDWKPMPGGKPVSKPMQPLKRKKPTVNTGISSEIPEATSPSMPAASKPEIPMADIQAAGIKLPEEVGPIREPTVDVAKRLAGPRISAGDIPVVDGLNPLLLEKWKHPTRGPIGWSSSPIASNSEYAIYTASSDGVLYKLDLETGKEIWSFDAGSPLMASPILHGNQLTLASSDGVLYHLDVEDAKVKWERNLEGGVVATPGRFENLVVASTRNGRICCLDTRSGEGIWAYDSNSPIVGGTSIYRDVVFFGTRGRKIFCLDLKTGRSVWSVRVDGSVVASPAVSVDSVYVGTQAGTFYALDVQSGQTLWEYQTDNSIVAGAQIIFTSVIFCSQDKWLYCCEKYDGSLKWKVPVRGRVQAALGLAEKSVIAVSKEGWMQGFELKTGKLIWQKNFETRLESTPLIIKEGMIVASVDGAITFYAFGAHDLKKSA